MNFLENALIHINTILDKKNIQKLEKAYENAYLESVRYRSAILAEHQEMNAIEKIKYSVLMYAFDDAKCTLLEYIQKKNVKSDILYHREEDFLTI